MKPRFNISTRVTVRFSDTDAMGHCNNARIISFMEEGRVAYFKKLFPDQSLSDQFKMFPFILAEIQCSFKSPSFCNEIIIVNLGTTQYGNKSFVLEYELIEEQTRRVIATGKSVQVMYDYHTKTTYKIPDELKNRMKQIEGDPA
ncbi:MAG: acyl-CoA thioesterase [Deltaproteobacteria bacterium]|nr:acyl-CoA thioesterase [Deltaproteobacteria bacterium]